MCFELDFDAVKGKLAQPQLNSKVGFDMEMTLDHHHHHHPPQTQCHQYLSCSWPNFTQTLKVGLWDQQQPYKQQQHEQQLQQQQQQQQQQQ